MLRASPTATPLTSAMVLVLLITALWLHTHPGDMGPVVAWASTNVHNLADHPVAAMMASTFVEPGSLIPDVLIVGASFAIVERAIGARRTGVIALTGQVVATLLTEYGSQLGAHWHLLAESSADRSDVGVSYAMCAVVAAAAMLIHGSARVLGLLTVGAWVLCPFALSPGMTSTGHVLSVAIEVAVMTLTPSASRHEDYSRVVGLKAGRRLLFLRDLVHPVDNARDVAEQLKQ